MSDYQPIMPIEGTPDNLKPTFDELLRVLNDRFRNLSTTNGPVSSDGQPLPLFSTHVARPDPNQYPLGTYFSETDTGNTFECQGVGVKKWALVASLLKAITWNALPALQNGWTATNVGAHGALLYGIDAFGIVRLKGEVAPGTKTDGTLLFTLPVGFRPPFARVAPVAQTFSATLIDAWLYVSANGQVLIFDVSSTCTSMWLDTSFPTT